MTPLRERRGQNKIASRWCWRSNARARPDVFPSLATVRNIASSALRATVAPGSVAGHARQSELSPVAGGPSESRTTEVYYLRMDPSEKPRAGGSGSFRPSCAGRTFKAPDALIALCWRTRLIFGVKIVGQPNRHECLGSAPMRRREFAVSRAIGQIERLVARRLERRVKLRYAGYELVILKSAWSCIGKADRERVP